jgi:NIPSNAP
MQSASRRPCRFAAVYRELRVYTVKPGAMEAWVNEWRAHVYPLRRKLGFSIPAAWVVEGEDRFVWLLEYAGDDYVAANEAYYASRERRAFEPEPTRHLAATEHWPLRSIV